MGEEEGRDLRDGHLAVHGPVCGLWLGHFLLLAVT